MKQKLDHWLLGLTRGTIQGGAAAIKTFAATACANAAGVGVPAVNLKQAAVAFPLCAWRFALRVLPSVLHLIPIIEY
jgi:hypothetical protein